MIVKKTKSIVYECHDCKVAYPSTKTVPVLNAKKGIIEDKEEPIRNCLKCGKGLQRRVLRKKN